ncbi:hypothetical protein NQ315_002287 [Exocentrus adspersus]|uniref:Uncharacterized protein n=1 Tax=Exocentrus adspersus TaxID=1586481 RepID=A0AAV8VTP2_9CUCU|nr:hypothetical protein NQ315_002287 [Exocentrus adspersus]
MTNFRYLLVYIFLSCFLFEGFLAQDTNETKCFENGLTADNETVDGNFDSFAAKLESYTGLGASPVSVTVRCDSTPCVVNPNGTAIWEARQYFYLSNMMSNTNGSETTLDGCLCYSQDSSEYQTCMSQVRDSMISQLDTVLLDKFREIVESDCGSFQTNCLIEA